jgi:hypothetical protein
VLTLDNKPIPNLSSVTVYLFNDDVDFTDVPVFITFEPVNGQQPLLVEARPRVEPEGVVSIDAERASPNDQRLRVGYRFPVLNRRQAVQLDFLFEGASAPAVSVDTLAKGLRTEQVTINQLQVEQIRTAIRYIVTALVSLGVGMVLVLRQPSTVG